jgi:translation initiation factor 3 subunit A
LENLDADKLLALQEERLEIDRREHVNKLKSLAKKLDFTERAYRKEEIPLLEADQEKQRIEEEELYGQIQFNRKKASKDEHIAAMALKKQFQKLLTHFNKYKKAIEEKHAMEHANLIKTSKLNIESAKQKRREEFKSKKLQDWKVEQKAKRDNYLKEEEEKRQKIGNDFLLISIHSL